MLLEGHMQKTTSVSSFPRSPSSVSRGYLSLATSGPGRVSVEASNLSPKNSSFLTSIRTNRKPLLVRSEVSTRTPEHRTQSTTWPAPAHSSIHLPIPVERPRPTKNMDRITWHRSLPNLIKQCFICLFILQFENRHLLKNEWPIVIWRQVTCVPTEQTTGVLEKANNCEIEFPKYTLGHKSNNNPILVVGNNSRLYV